MGDAPLTWVDGKPARDLPLPDRGMAFGDGFFETLLISRGTALFPEYHLDRLHCGLEMLGFPPVNTLGRDINITAGQLREVGWPWASLRLTVTRGSGPRGYSPPDEAQARVVIEANRIERDCAAMLAPASLDVATVRLARQPALAGLKHLNRLEQVIAAREAQASNADDLVMLDTNGEVVGVVAGNLFLRRGSTLYTPPLRECGVAGTRRRLVIEQWAERCSLAVEQSALTVDDFAQADEVFITNSLVTVRPVARVMEHAQQDHSAASALFELFRSELP